MNAKHRDWIKTLTAICEGYSPQPAEGYIVVENPDATPEALALGGVDPNLVIDCGELISFIKEHTNDQKRTRNSKALLNL